MAVKTARSLPLAAPASAKLLAIPTAALAAPKAVIGTEMAAGSENPKRGVRMKDNFPPTHVRKGTS